MEKTFKGKFEYCHILTDKIVITKSPVIGDLVDDYATSINDFLKTLMVFFYLDSIILLPDTHLLLQRSL